MDSGLQEVPLFTEGSNWTNSSVNAKYRADRYVHINIATAVQRIQQTNIFRLLTSIILERKEIFEFFADDASTMNTMFQDPNKLIVCENIQFFYFLLLHVKFVRLSQNI